MLPLKLVRSLISGTTITNPLLQTPSHHSHETTPEKPTTRTPLLIFIPTQELVTDTYKLATLARLIGLDFCPSPSLSHLIFSPPSSNNSSLTSVVSSFSSTSLGLPNGAVSIPFPDVVAASVGHLRCFVGISRGFFKLVFLKSDLGDVHLIGRIEGKSSNWDCCSFSLVLRMSNCRIVSMDCFCRALAGKGWTFFKTKYGSCVDSGERPVWGTNAVYLFRKTEAARVLCRQGSGGGGGECRMREMRLPPLDFRNAPLRILQYILLMTDDMFYLA
ncbi:hypothetical protein DCAR_0417899 [Daucus carota subsp. sativus]|uniref:Uncharacterized protein n=1 Tax=Daucus carota subsp. sativus TaxID=79200 RepID=A0A165Z0D5_DAUCS|nr:PREDICTED: uncharacterized protein LOC108217862 [Daucus carota subsp. sativus]XP_017246245.1 PREDICTED: uncharacterized protein LOC108217862 [Daucus carota subsp. sativus]WOG98555.1 hypothetical protein DCAR_0417899 [Daucus carota subsp. sativus]